MKHQHNQRRNEWEMENVSLRRVVGINKADILLLKNIADTTVFKYFIKAK